MVEKILAYKFLTDIGVKTDIKTFDELPYYGGINSAFIGYLTIFKPTSIREQITDIIHMRDSGIIFENMWHNYITGNTKYDRDAFILYCKFVGLECQDATSLEDNMTTNAYNYIMEKYSKF